MTYANIDAEIEVDDVIVYTHGPVKDWDWGRVDEIDGDTALVAWSGSRTSTSVPLALVARCVPYRSVGAARIAYERACAQAE